MWTIDSRCSRCWKKGGCSDRVALIGALSPLTNTLNTEEPHVSGPGDGVLIVACNDFAIAE